MIKALLFTAGLLMSSNAFTQDRHSVFVHFAFNKYELTATARATLDSLTDTLDLADHIELHGHTDASGSDEYNIRLSAQRVKTVENYLLSIGWEKKDIITVQAHGEAKPLNDNGTEDNRSLNRRVEIRIIHGTANSSLKEKLADSTLKTGTNITLRNIQFEGGLHLFLNSSYPALQELLDAMRTYTKLVIQVEGHICCEYTKDDGTDLETGLSNLSQARAKAVMDYLVENGIDAARISYKGFGHSKPLYPYPEETEEQRIANRRVEIKIISK